MKHAIRSAVVVLPLGLLFAGCGGTRSKAIADRSPPRSRTTMHPVAIKGDDHHVVMMDEVARTPHHEAPTVLDKQHDITLDQIREHLKNNTAVIIDARSPEAFAQGHIRGAINVPASQIEAFVPQIKKNVSEDELIIIYCASSSCGSGDMVYDYLTEKGYTYMRVYKPGWQQLASATNLQ
jgi:rhodanese-related sulfurtransferase